MLIGVSDRCCKCFHQRHPSAHLPANVCGLERDKSEGVDVEDKIVHEIRGRRTIILYNKTLPNPVNKIGMRHKIEGVNPALILEASPHLKTANKMFHIIELNLIIPHLHLITLHKPKKIHS